MDGISWRSLDGVRMFPLNYLAQFENTVMIERPFQTSTSSRTFFRSSVRENEE